MKKSASVVKLKSVQRRFAKWRGSRAHGKVKIPADLWQQAVALCRDHKVSEVSRELGLENGALYRELKKTGLPRRAKKSVFISVPISSPLSEVVSDSGGGSSLDCEWMRSDGARLRVRGLGSKDLGQMVTTFLQRGEL